MKRLLYVWALAVCGLPSIAGACVFAPSTEEKLAKSDVVFAGTVTETKCDGSTGYAMFDVRKRWKGTEIPQERLTLSCRHYPLTQGKEYLIFAKLDGGKELHPLNDSCPGSVQAINGRWKEWWLKESTYVAVSGKPSWSFSIQGSAIHDMETLDRVSQ